MAKKKEMDVLKERMWNFWRYFCEPVLTQKEREIVSNGKCIEITNSEKLGLLKLEDSISKIKIQTKDLEGKRTWEIHIDADSPILKVVDDRDGLK